jgi:UDP-glucuronate 4-epimerase
MKILVTGAAGFIGAAVSRKLINAGYLVVGLDNLNDYYDTKIKYGRVELAGIDSSKIIDNYLISSSKDSYSFIKMDLRNREKLNELFKIEKFDHVINLAAQAGVRYSIDNPHAYVDSNIVGYFNLLEACRQNDIKHLVYASSSSVYGLNTCHPFSTSDNVDHPVSFYAATKKSNELMSHVYSHLYGIPTSGLRFFTVYGPWGRPDMAYFKFTKSILNDESIDVYNEGVMSRDFTYIDDVVECVVRINAKPPVPNPNWDSEVPDPASSSAPFRICNIGNSKPVALITFIDAIEKSLGKKAKKNMLPIQQGDVVSTYAETSALQRDFGYLPETNFEEGVNMFIEWYRMFYKI